MKTLEERKEIWKTIPENIDILVTHSAPYNILDTDFTGKHYGCEVLADEVLNRIKPKYHLFGHIH